MTYELEKEFEGLRLEAYQDSVGIWTIGYGHTRTAKKGMKITEVKADNLLASDVVSAVEDVDQLVKAPLTPNEHEALVDFTFNLGGHALATSTMLRLINAGRMEEAAKEFLKWNKAGGKVLQGLVCRREAEKKLFETK